MNRRATGRQSGHSTKLTKTEKLFALLKDYDWHATRELVRRVGHCFTMSKLRLVRLGYRIAKQHHPTKRYQYLYRLEDRS